MRLLYSSILMLVGRLILRVCGWKVTNLRPDVKRAVAIMAPHTSTWDIWLALASIAATQTKFYWIGKHSLFRGPLGWLFRTLGGVPLNRSQAKDTVKIIAEEFRRREEFTLGIAPEASRSHTARWRTGFNRIALAADVPVKFCYLDYARKECGCGKVVKMTGNIEEDLQVIKDFYNQIMPANPARYSPIRFDSEELRGLTLGAEIHGGKTESDKGLGIAASPCPT